PVDFVLFVVRLDPNKVALTIFLMASVMILWALFGIIPFILFCAFLDILLKRLDRFRIRFCQARISSSAFLSYSVCHMSSPSFQAASLLELYVQNHVGKHYYPPLIIILTGKGI